MGGFMARSRRYWSATRWCLDVRSERSACERGWRVLCERGVSEVISLSLSLSLSLFLSLCVWDPEMVCSENRNVNQFSGQNHKTHGQRKCFSEKFYFPCATKHTMRCKIISWNGFTPKQTQPKFHSFPIKSSVNVLLVTTVNFYLFRKNVNKKSKQKANNL